jgi:hypothetical protein
MGHERVSFLQQSLFSRSGIRFRYKILGVMEYWSLEEPE